MAPSPAPPLDRDRRRRRWRRPRRVPRPVNPPTEPPSQADHRRLPGPGRPPSDHDRVSATVATRGNEGVTEFSQSGDLTGTADIQDAVYSQGAGVAPQLHYGRNAAFQQETAQAVSEASEEPG